MAESFLYIIGPASSDRYKIGFSADPDRRLRQLQTGHGEKLHVHHRRVVDESKVDVLEKLIHNANRHRKVRGEWFKMSIEESIDEIEFALIKYDDEPNLKARLKNGSLR